MCSSKNNGAMGWKTDNLVCFLEGKRGTSGIKIATSGRILMNLIPEYLEFELWSGKKITFIHLYLLLYIYDGMQLCMHVLVSWQVCIPNFYYNNLFWRNFNQYYSCSMSCSCLYFCFYEFWDYGASMDTWPDINSFLLTYFINIQCHKAAFWNVMWQPMHCFFGVMHMMQPWN